MIMTKILLNLDISEGERLDTFSIHWSNKRGNLKHFYWIGHDTVEYALHLITRMIMISKSSSSYSCTSIGIAHIRKKLGISSSNFRTYCVSIFCLVSFKSISIATRTRSNFRAYCRTYTFIYVDDPYVSRFQSDRDENIQIVRFMIFPVIGQYWIDNIGFITLKTLWSEYRFKKS